MSTRQEFVEKVKQQVDDLDNELDKLDVKADKASEDVRHEWERRKLDLKENRHELMSKLKEAQSAADDAWDQVKESLVAARQKFSEGVKDIRETLSR